MRPSSRTSIGFVLAGLTLAGLGADLSALPADAAHGHPKPGAVVTVSAAPGTPTTGSSATTVGAAGADATG